MKLRKILLSILCLGAVLSASGQGMVFSAAKWSEVQKIAKKENKLIFIDLFTVWCGPCKLMTKNVFPLEEVGKFYNANFINFTIDAEKGDGIRIAKQYKVNSFPTYLFVDGDGKLFYRSMGAMLAEKFLAEGAIALGEFADGETLAEMTDKYEKQKTDPAFLLRYIEKRKKAKLDNADLLDEYVSLCSESQLLDTSFLKSVQSFENFVNAGGSCEAFMIKNWNKLAEVSGVSDMALADVMTFNILDYSLNKAIKEKNVSLLEATIRTSDFLCPKLRKNAENKRIELRSQYYAGTKDADSFEALIDDYTKALYTEENTVLQKDKEMYKMFLSSLIANPSDLSSVSADQLEMALDISKQRNAIDLSYEMRDLAANIVSLSDKPEMLQTALLRAMEAVFLFDNFTNYETLADVLFKMGRIDDATRQMQHARDIMLRESEEINKRIDTKLETYKNFKK